MSAFIKQIGLFDTLVVKGQWTLATALNEAQWLMIGSHCLGEEPRESINWSCSVHVAILWRCKPLWLITLKVLPNVLNPTSIVVRCFYPVTEVDGSHYLHTINTYLECIDGWHVLHNSCSNVNYIEAYCMVHCWLEGMKWQCYCMLKYNWQIQNEVDIPEIAEQGR